MATPDSETPQIYISYSRKDALWLERVLERLKPMEESRQIRVFHDRLLGPGDRWDQELRAQLESAALVIVLLSPDWLVSDYATKVEFTALASRHVIPVLVSDCDWQKHPIGRFQILMARDRPLSAADDIDQEQALRTLVQAIQVQLGLSPAISLSREGQQLCELASRFARSAKVPGPIDAACLAYAFLERGRAEDTPVKTPQFFWNAIPESARSRYVDLRRERFPLFSSPAPSAAADVGPSILARAASLSIDSLAGGPVHARHLLAVVLTDPDGLPILNELELDLASFKRDFLAFVFRVFPDEPKGPWTDFLEPGAGSTPGPLPESEPDPAGVAAPTGLGSSLTAAYQSEDWTGPDLLNTTRDVNALAALVAGWNVQPPLSIGLFGEWGSGKSFFMRQMRERVKALALAAQTSGKPQRECAYYKNIAQIEFNAWHYMEGNNLWACLVEHIFSNLGFPQDTKVEQVQARQMKILEQIGAKRSLEAQAARTRAELEAKRSKAGKEANEARTQLDAAETALQQEKSELGNRIVGQLSSEVTAVLNSIPEAVQLRDAAETARQLTEDSRSLWGRMKLLWNLLRHDPQRRRILYWVLGGSAILFAVSEIVHRAAPEFQLLVRQEVQVLLSIVPALVGAAVKFRRVIAKGLRIVSVLERKNQEIAEAISRAEREQRQQVAKLESEVQTLSLQLIQATTEEQQHKEAISKLERELADTDANRLLAEFIRSRAEADDYRKHLGMVALVRRDFERLSDFFRSQRAAERSGKERPDNNTVNRIILYIDDLDRCPPQTVVSTLQAIHLLLAFPIFVVVVAVDSRWVSRSLEQCYEWLVPETRAAERPHISANGAERMRSNTGATAHDYIEKIFQIPFWLAPMDSKACQFMIRGLTEAVAREQAALKQSIATAKRPDSAPLTLAADAAGSGPASPQPSTSAAAQVSPPSSPSPTVTEPTAAEPAPASSEPAPAPGDHIDLAPRQLDIEEAELRKIDELAVLIGRSPRVAKRFLNCYRLLKARMTQAELETFLEGPYQHVMEVLAIIVGAPSISRVVVDTLSAEGTGQDGKSFVEYLKNRLSAENLAASEGVEVARLLSAASHDHMKSLRAVAPLVSRFSFAAQSEKVRDTGKTPRRKAKSMNA